MCPFSISKFRIMNNRALQLCNWVLYEQRVFYLNPQSEKLHIEYNTNLLTWLELFKSCSFLYYSLTNCFVSWFQCKEMLTDCLSTAAGAIEKLKCFVQGGICMGTKVVGCSKQVRAMLLHKYLTLTLTIAARDDIKLCFTKKRGKFQVLLFLQCFFWELFLHFIRIFLLFLSHQTG